MNNPFNYLPDPLCEEAFHNLLLRIESLKQSTRHEDVAFCRELEEGKMLGVLVATDATGAVHTLYAFSGQLGNSGFHFPGFVEPVFDYLQPDGYFKINEADISRQNIGIAKFEKETFAEIKSDYEKAKLRMDAEVEALKERYRKSKQIRDEKRRTGQLDETELVAMTRQSQFEKAEIHRLKKRVAADLKPFAEKLKRAETQLSSMKEKRRNDSEALQQWLFNNFKFLNAHGDEKGLNEIFAETSLKIPPSGAGECCAPKLLQAAYKQGWNPVSMAEYWYGKPKGGEVRIQGEHYAACRGKCLPILTWMLQGLEINPPLNSEWQPDSIQQPEIIYENRWFCVVNKPSGMLSVPGKGTVKSVQDWLEEKYGKESEVKVVHRLDQDTSGLLIAAFGALCVKVLQRLFAFRRVHKTYIAYLEGDYISLGLPQHGRISLPLSSDWLDRPRQRIDFENGKEAVTEYEFAEVSNGRSRVVFHPLTGRTHQLRVHAASEYGLGMPIVGDRLYGKNSVSHRERLHLHAYEIEFSFPIDKQHYIFKSPLQF